MSTGCDEKALPEVLAVLPLSGSDEGFNCRTVHPDVRSLWCQSTGDLCHRRTGLHILSQQSVWSASQRPRCGEPMGKRFLFLPTKSLWRRVSYFGIWLSSQLSKRTAIGRSG